MLHAETEQLREFYSPKREVASCLEVLGPYGYELRHQLGLQHGNAN